MQILPIKIKTYKLNITAVEFVRRIRGSSWLLVDEEKSLYSPDHYIPARIEKEKGIYIKNRKDRISRYGGGTTGIFIENNNSENKITVIQYFGWQQSLILVLLLLGTIWCLIKNEDWGVLLTALVGFNLIMAIINDEKLKKQLDYIHKIINEP
ncbi:MAG: hypothetical protein KKH44_09825 [Bacteroidetes bacterium]|nr:hypothetical protein [Bacteroidota bacterium]